MTLTLRRTLSRASRLAPLFCCLAFAGCEEKIAQEPVNSAPSLGTPSASNSSSTPEKPATTDSKLKRLILLTNGNSPFWDACRAGLLDAEKELQLASAGFSAVMDVSNYTSEGQLDRLKHYGTQTDVAGIALSVVSADNVAIVEEMRKLQQKGVKVLTVDSDIDRQQFRDARTAFIGTDNVGGGEVLGMCAKGLRPEGGDYVTFVGIAAAQNVIDRTSGFAKGAGDAFRLKDMMADGSDTSRARDNVRNAIRNHPELKTLVGIWSYNAPAIVDVVTELNRRADFTIVTFDAEPLAVTGMGKGNIDAMVVQNPYAMGYESMRLLKALASDQQDEVRNQLPTLGEPDGDLFDTGLKVVVPNADSPLKSVTFPSSVQFLTLPEFQKWLDKYGLSGS